MNDSTSLELIESSEFPAFGVANTDAVPCRKAQAAAPSISEVEIHQVADAVCRSTSLKSVRLPDEFYPGHLSVALIERSSMPRRGSTGGRRRFSRMSRGTAASSASRACAQCDGRCPLSHARRPWAT